MEEFVRLHSGHSIPAISFGLGTSYRDRPKEDLVWGILKAYDKGYRHFDTAIVYNTEQFLGETLNNLTGITVTTKIHSKYLKYEEVKKVETKNSLGSVLARSFDNGFC